MLHYGCYYEKAAEPGWAHNACVSVMCWWRGTSARCHSMPAAIYDSPHILRLALFQQAPTPQ